MRASEVSLHPGVQLPLEASLPVTPGEQLRKPQVGSCSILQLKSIFFLSNKDLISAPPPERQNTEEGHPTYSEVAKKSGAHSSSAGSPPPPPPPAPPRAGTSKTSSSPSQANKNGNSFYSFLKR